jgi:hypothetical protein
MLLFVLIRHSPQRSRIFRGARTASSDRPKCLSAAALRLQSRWEKFNPKWREALDHAGVSTFHSKCFYAFKGAGN